MKQPAALLVLQRPLGEPLPPSDGQIGASWVVLGPPSAAHPRPACSVSKSSCTCAQRTGCAQGAAPSALPGSTAAIGCLSHRPDACTCRPRRDQPAQAGLRRASGARDTRHWPAVMMLRLIGLPADHAVASHRAADGAVPSIEGARTHAGATSRGAAGRFPRVSARASA
jgi:hypothetical protein